ncbi:MAG: ATP-dependent zinc metalloprotease FtsH, partial [bacterium]
GKSRAKLLIDNKPKTSFEDVAGLDEAKEELREVIDFLKSTEKFRRVGARIPKGVLLIGPPGCGKTLLARAVAGEANVPFVHISGSEFVELFVGVGASRVRDLYMTAEKNAPCVVFIDEIDAVGRQRGAGLGGGHDEREQTLNQLLVEMDGFDTNRGVVILAATNRPDILDPALLRPGRFDRRVVIDRPDQKGRLDILKVHSRVVPLAPDVDLALLAQRTPGFTGADLAHMVNEAAILAARENKLKVELRHFEEAIERVIAGPQRKSRIIGEKEKEIVAFHEGGHALLGWVLPFADKVHKISILPRGLALGYTLQLPEQDKYIITKNELLDKMTVLLGGRVAEEIIFDEISTGAQNDLEELTELARRMVKEYGMSTKLGPITFGKRYGGIFLGRDFATERDYSEDTAEQIDQEVHSIVQSIHERARAIMRNYKEALKKIAHRLMKTENIDKEEFTRLMTELGVPANTERMAFVPEVSA